METDWVTIVQALLHQGYTLSEVATICGCTDQDARCLAQEVEHREKQATAATEKVQPELQFV